MYDFFEAHSIPRGKASEEGMTEGTECPSPASHRFLRLMRIDIPLRNTLYS